MNYQELIEKARDIRISIIDMITEAKSGHPGGSLSAADIMTYLYFKEMNVKTEEPNWEYRDRFVLSKGHAAPALYATLALKGFFDTKELNGLRKFGSMLQGHPDSKKIPGVDVSTGSLGQGISNAVGMALGAKLDSKDIKIYVLLGDGELQEGLVWEAAMAGSHYKLDNLIAIIDYNGLQIDGVNEAVMGVSPLNDKWKSFGWHVIEVNGHSFEELEKAFDEIKNTKDKPTVLIAKTIKGKGVSFMENQAGWHGQAPSKEQRHQAIIELQAVEEGGDQ